MFMSRPMMRPQNPVGCESCRAMNRGGIVSRTSSLARLVSKAHIAVADLSFPEGGDRPSQIAQPGQIPTSCPVCHKPIAWHIKNCHSENPHRVNKRQTMAVPRGPLSKVYTEMTMQYRLV